MNSGTGTADGIQIFFHPEWILLAYQSAPLWLEPLEKRKIPSLRYHIRLRKEIDGADRLREHLGLIQATSYHSS